MAKPNYAFAKRQRDIAKKQKKEAKQKLKNEAKQSSTGEEQPAPLPADRTKDV
jgi:hypothetical protein